MHEALREWATTLSEGPPTVSDFTGPCLKTRFQLASIVGSKNLRNGGPAGSHKASFHAGERRLVHGRYPWQPLPREASNPASSGNEFGQIGYRRQGDVRQPLRDPADETIRYGVAVQQQRDIGVEYADILSDRYVFGTLLAIEL
jgi:hypothetical protein